MNVDGEEHEITVKIILCRQLEVRLSGKRLTKTESMQSYFYELMLQKVAMMISFRFEATRCH